MKHDGRWNGYVACGATKDERRARLAEVPAEYRDGVISHLRTIAAIRERERWKREEKARWMREEKAPGNGIAGRGRAITQLAKQEPIA